MSFAVVHMQKMTFGQVGGMQIHNQREKEISHTNPDIDFSKSHQNYDLVNNEPIKYLKAIKDRISELNLPKAVRKDAVLMCSFIVTSDHDFFQNLTPEETKQFFRESTEFFSQRYGERNILAATVHVDERTPHMHLCMVPVTADGRLSAKSIFTKKELTELQTSFARDVGSKYGLDRGVEGSQREHLEVAEFKRETLQGEIAELQAQKNELTAAVMLPQALDRIQPKKTATGTIKGVSVEEINQLKGAARAAFILKHENEDLKQERIELKRRIPSMAERTKQAAELSALRGEVTQLRHENGIMKKILGEHGLLQELARQIKSLFSHSRDMER